MPSDPPLPVDEPPPSDPAAAGDTLVAMLDRLFHRGFLGDEATGAMVGVIDGASLRLLGAVGDLPPVAPRGFEVPLAVDLPLCRAARLGVAVLLPDRASMDRASTLLAAFAPNAGSAVFTPIRDGSGVIGAYGVTYGHAWSDEGPLTNRLHEIGVLLGRMARGHGAPPGG